jgi:hypothetical protein
VDISVSELWVDYFALGGMATALEIDAYLNGALVATVEDRELLAVALNERYAARGDDHPLPYAGDEPRAP